MEMTDTLKNITRGTVLAILLAIPARGMAQLHEQISVDGKYVPEVIRIDRIYTFPQALRESLPVSPLEYESSGVATSFSPSLMVMPATTWNASRRISTEPGYVEFGIGSWLNSTLSAGYRFVDNSSTVAGVRLQHNSTSLWKPKLSSASAGVRQKRYDEAIGVYGSHTVGGYGRIDASLDYHAGWFNYYGYSPRFYGDSGHHQVDAPTQTLNDVVLRADWHSLVKAASSLRYSAGVDVSHFGYRSLPLPYHDDSYPDKGGRETSVNLHGSLSMPWGNNSTAGTDASLDIVSPSQADTYSLLSIKPFYRFEHSDIRVRIGAEVDLAFNAGEKGHRYSFFHIAPDLSLSYRKGAAGLFLTATGGSTLNTLRRLHQYDYYGIPAVITTRPSYSPVDAAAGINLGPFSGFSIGAEMRYKVVKNVPLGGWYMYWLTEGATAPAHLTPQVAQGAQINMVDDVYGIDLHGFSLAGKVAYEYGKCLRISGELAWQPQEGKKGWFNGYDRAAVTAAFKVRTSPVERLDLGIDLDYRGRRGIYTTATQSVGSVPTLINGNEVTLHRLPLPHIFMAGIYGSWSFTDNFSVWLQGDNLLNRHDEMLPLQPLQGIGILAGLKWIF